MSKKDYFCGWKRSRGILAAENIAKDGNASITNGQRNAMTKDYESEANELDGRTKLLNSRPEPDTYVGKTLVRNSFLATALT